MSEADLIELSFDRHDVECPHCHKQTALSWPGNTILFAATKCTRCGRDFLIALNEPQLVS